MEKVKLFKIELFVLLLLIAVIIVCTYVGIKSIHSEYRNNKPEIKYQKTIDSLLKINDSIIYRSDSIIFFLKQKKQTIKIIHNEEINNIRIMDIDDQVKLLSRNLSIKDSL